MMQNKYKITLFIMNNLLSSIHHYYNLFIMQKSLSFKPIELSNNFFPTSF